MSAGTASLPVVAARPRPNPAAAEARLLAVVGVVLLTLLVCAGVSPAGGRVTLPLWQAGLAVGADGRIQPITDQARLVPGTRVLADAPGAAALARAQRAWLAAGTVPHPAGLPSVPGRDDMVADALLDLRLLSAGGAPLAGWSPAWHYVWPRDSAFVAVAFASTGHYADAERVLDVLRSVQGADGTFQARYEPGSDLPPDGRAPQLDGTGWAVWALAQTALRLPPDQRVALVSRERTLLDRSTTLLLARTAGPGFPVSSDYWELPEREPTLATAAVLLAGLSAAGTAYRMIGENAAADTAEAAAGVFRSRLVRMSSPGFGRHLGDDATSADLGVAFLLPPFAPRADPGIVSAWQRSLDVMARPNGGLGPGGAWRSDGISWTPSVATEAMVAAAIGDRARADRMLAWIDRNRTTQGAIPEKVLWNGRPAYVAPLAWSAAAVVIAAATLER